MTPQPLFQAHVELLELFVNRRHEVIERIEGLLNSQRKPIDELRNRSLLARRFEDCFCTLPGLTHGQTQMRGQLEQAHRASGFTPRELSGLENGLVGPAEMMIRAFHLWQQTRWPGRNGRVRYAQTLFTLYVVRSLALLSMRVWDAGVDGAGDRLSHVQAVLDRLCASAPADQPALVRDARWLIPLAQSPATDDLGAYFDIADNVAVSFADEDRLEIHKAGARMAAGHLRSQIRYYTLKKSVLLDAPEVVLSTRSSNALDFALLIHDLVPLLQAYEHAVHCGDERARLELADAICQGISPDPELFVNRTELLGAYSMIDYLFVRSDPDGGAAHTPAGHRHVQLLDEYEAVIGRVAKPLFDDCSHFRPVAGAYSPYGLLYGFSSDLIGHMAFKTLLPDAMPRFGFEDVFVAGDSDKLAWVSGWRKLPHLTREVAALFEYPQQFAEDVFARVEEALRRRVFAGAPNASARTGRLFIAPEDDPGVIADASLIPELPIRYVGSSDRELVAAHKACPRDETQLSSDQREGRCLVRYATAGGSVAVAKDVLTEVLGAGRDVRLVGLPRAAAGVLKLTCPRLVAVDASAPS